MTNTNNLLLTVAGKKNDGKTTTAYYVSKQLDTPLIIIDIAEQFKPKKAHQHLIRGINALKYYLDNPILKEVFYKGRQEIIFRCSSTDEETEIKELFNFIYYKKIKNISLLCDEFELYAGSRENKSSPIFRLFYKSRNLNVNIICVIKEIGELNKLYRSATDYYLLGQILEPSARERFNERGNNNGNDKNHVTTILDSLTEHEFLFTDFNKLYETFKVNKSILQIMK